MSTGNVVVVTGAAGNMGQAVVKKFLDEGHKVVGTIVPGDPVKWDMGSQYFFTEEADLSNEQAAQAAIQKIIKERGTIDIAVLTVGGFAMGKIAETGLADIQKQIHLNFETAYNTARPIFLEMMQKGRGRIFLIGSKPGLDSRNGKGMVAYSIAKSMIFRLAELMNEEAKGTDVVVCVVVPSTIDTPQNRKSMPDSDTSKWVKPEAIADAIYFYTTGEAAVLREPVLKVYGRG